MKKLMPLFLTLFVFITLRAQTDDQPLSPYFKVFDEETAASLPLEQTAVEANIAGVVADVKVSQRYRNTGEKPIEAVYVFPASTRAAVHAMRMQVGERTIEAEIRERKQARQEYETAKFEGRRASLLEQERPNVFQMNVANIMPGEEVIVVLEYTELLIPEEGTYSFVYPTVVGPRYTTQTAATADNQDTFTKQAYHPVGTPVVSRLDINVSLDAGMPIQWIESSTHELVLQQKRKQASVRLAEKEHYSKRRDFILQYRLRGDAVHTGLLTYEHEDENFFLLMLQPPARVRDAELPPREYVFVVDVSGSMNGFPLDVSKTLLRKLLGSLQPYDRFNILFFAGASNWLSNTSLPAESANIEQAIEFLSGMRGGGGTELLPALHRGFDLPTCEVGVSRSLIVITDGYVTVEREAYDLIREKLNAANLFAFGIGSSVNRYLIEGMAHVGMGEPFIATNHQEALTLADRFQRYIQYPVLSDVQVSFEGMEAYDVLPAKVPDLLADRPLLIYGKYRKATDGRISVSGQTGQGTYRKSIALQDASPHPRQRALRQIWAREQIRLLDDYQQLSPRSEDEARVTTLGLKYNLMTAYTSFVAIEMDRIANTSGTAERVQQTLPLPQGVSNSAVGFDLGIEKVVRHAAPRLSINRVVVDNWTPSQRKNLQQALQGAFPQATSQVQTQLQTSEVVKLYFDDTGQLTSVFVDGIRANSDLFTWFLQCLNQHSLSTISNQIIIHLNPKS